MKSLFTILILFTGIVTNNLLAQPWIYDFGTAIGSFTTASSTSGFLPDPPTGGGSDQVRVGNTGGGFALVNPGSDSELQITAASGMGPYTGTAVINKFSVYDYTDGTSFSIGFNIRFECDASDNGRGYFFIGDGDYFTSADRYVGADLYTGIRWFKGAGDAFLITGILNSAGDDYDNISEDFSLNTEYYVEMFGNNTASSIDYDYNGTQTLSAYKYDLWIDGTQVIDDRPRSLNTMGNGAPIDSYMILAEGSTDNNLVVIVDDFTYSNQVGGIIADIKVFLEGPYNGSGAMTTTLNTNNFIPLNSNDAYSTAVYGYTACTVSSIPNADIVDWVLVELRTGTASGTKVGTRAAFLKSDGTIVDTNGSSPVTFTGLTDGNYYVVVIHRNHLDIMTASAIPLSGSSVLYDLSTSQSQAYTTGTDPMVDLTGSVYGMIAADANTSGIVTNSDKDEIINELNNAGYYNADINMSGIVTNSDKDLIINNLNMSSLVP